MDLNWNKNYRDFAKLEQTFSVFRMEKRQRGAITHSFRSKVEIFSIWDRLHGAITHFSPSRFEILQTSFYNTLKWDEN